MAKEVAGLIKLQIKGGAANPSPPVGPALGSKGINIMEFCKQFNARTQDKAGKILPVIITYYADKSFDFVIKTPPVAIQLLEVAKVKSGSAEPNRKKVAELTWEQIRTIAQDKMVDLNCFTVDAAMRMVAGTARSMGIAVKGEFPVNNEKIKGGWTDIDVIITMPSIMGKIGALGRVLGPRGLMPNPKSGTVTMDVAKAVKEVKQGKIDFKVDKSGIVHTSIGKVSFSPDQIRDNAKEFISTLNKLKPTAAKGTYIKSIYLSSTMSAGIKIDPKSVDEI